jgi:hypothetical protein
MTRTEETHKRLADSTAKMAGAGDRAVQEALVWAVHALVLAQLDANDIAIHVAQRPHHRTGPR